ncbi:MAG: MgtC/SapB family protein [Chloroflexi bacterium]|nr:MgtC/SapB family protein [Chloroflexota bacterium]MDL1884338.1 MgtC/SapB family protein [Anaerolineae bacterium CFX8]
MSLYQQAEAVFYLLVAAVLSMLIGLDRERHYQPAGLRTHMLVGLGACLFTMLSVWAFPEGDPARIAAQIVSGIGFIGAGTILQRKGSVHHLTTAASIWATAAVGMAVGAGAWFLALGASVIIWIILAIIRVFTKYSRPRRRVKREDTLKEARESNEAEQ